MISIANYYMVNHVNFKQLTTANEVTRDLNVGL